MKSTLFSKKQLLFLLILSLAVSIRQVAMTMVMPFISVYAKSLTDYTPALAGVALGIFGLTQALFQIPFGIWSDKAGNKKVVLAGFMLVIIGLVLAYFAKDIYLLIWARALQGSGAVIAVVFSWISSAVDDKARLKALSMTSASIGFAAAASFAFGPLIHHMMSVNQMFLACAVIIAFSWILILVLLQEEKPAEEAVPSPPAGSRPFDLRTVFQRLLHNPAFLRLNIAAFLNNYIMVAVFFIVPQYLEQITGIDGMWKVFMPAVLVAILALKFTVRIAEKGYYCVILSCCFVFSVLGVGLFFRPVFGFILAGCILFMISYMCISTLAQTMVNEDDSIDSSFRGTANGVFNSLQYLGSFIGSLITGILWGVNQSLAIAVTIGMGILGIALLSGTYYSSGNKRFSDKYKARTT